MTKRIESKNSCTGATGSPEQVLTSGDDKHASPLSAEDLQRLIRERKKNPPNVPADAPTGQLTILGTTEWSKVVVEHRPGCRCTLKDDGTPAWMESERRVSHGNEVLDVQAAGGLYDALRAAVARRGRPFSRITELRRNERGEGIGPRLEVRSCEASAYYELQDQVVDLIERAADALAGVEVEGAA